jgi:GNAT superfamily N-acetyltransferase
MRAMRATTRSGSVKIRPLREADLDEADRIMRVAFGTFIGAPDPARFMGDAAYVRTRWRASPGSAFAAEVEGELAGSNFAARWGSFAFFGPLSLHPKHWDRGLASRLVEPVVELFDAWGVEHAGLFTFPHSAKHIGLYQKFGFRPRALTLVLGKPVRREPRPHAGRAFSDLDPGGRDEALAGCRGVTDAIFPGLDATPEIESVAAQSLGETVLVRDGARVRGFAVCHTGPGSEAGSDTCYVKFAATVPGADAEKGFVELLEACEDFAASAGAGRIVAGVNAARREAYEGLLSLGYRVALTGIAMHRPNEAGFSRPGVFVVDDWR